MSKASAARVQRKQGQKVIHQRVPVAPGPQAAPAQPQSRQHDMAFIQLVNRMLGGEVPPPNKYVSYQLGQLRTRQGEFEAINRNLQQAESQVQQLRAAAQAADGDIQGRLTDIKAWMDDADEQPCTTDSAGAHPPQAAAPQAEAEALQ